MDPYIPLKNFSLFFDKKIFFSSNNNKKKVAPTKTMGGVQTVSLWAGQNVTINVKTARCSPRVRYTTLYVSAEVIFFPRRPA